MWREIEAENFSDFQRFYDTQREVNDYYEQKLTPEFMKELFLSKSTRGIRAFIYEDGETFLNLCVKQVPTREGMHLHVVGANAAGADVGTKARIIHAKIQELLAEMKEVMAWGVWGIGANYPHGEAFFEAFCEVPAADNGKSYGYSACVKEVIEGRKSSKGILRMYL